MLSTEPSSPSPSRTKFPLWASAAATDSSPKKPAIGGAPAKDSTARANPALRTGRNAPSPAIAGSPPSARPSSAGPQVAATANAPSRNSEPPIPARKWVARPAATQPSCPTARYASRGRGDRTASAAAPPPTIARAATTSAYGA